MKVNKKVSALTVADGKNHQKEKLTGKEWRKHIKDNYPFLVMLLPAVAVVFLFNYLPIYGVLIAFQDFMPGDKIFSNTTIWVGFQNFTRFFTDVQFWPLMRNTFVLCILGFIIGFPLPIIISLMLNALKGRKGAKYLQTIFTAPHFISLVVLVGMLQIFFGRYGLVNNIVANLGGERFSYFLESSAFRPLYILSMSPPLRRFPAGQEILRCRRWFRKKAESLSLLRWTASGICSG